MLFFPALCCFSFSFLLKDEVDDLRRKQVAVVQEQLERVARQREELEASRRRNAVAVQGVATGGSIFF